MDLLDLSEFKPSATTKTTLDELEKLVSNVGVYRIGEGTYEVIVVDLIEKEGKKIRFDREKLGGTLEFSLNIENSAKEQQILFLSIPIACDWTAAVSQSEKNFIFKNSLSTLLKMKIDPNLFRESLINTNGKSAMNLIGAQFVIVNKWSDKMLHLEYDTTTQAHHFVNSSGERFESGEMACPFKIDFKSKDPYETVKAIAAVNGFKFKAHMDTQVNPHPTANNEKINESLKKFLQKKEEVKVSLDKKFPEFPKTVVKKPTTPIDFIEPDVEL